MKKKVLALILTCITTFSMLLTGCGAGEVDTTSMTPDDVEPIYYTAEEELPEDMYYIVHSDKEKDKDGKTIDVKKYYPLYLPERTFSSANDGACGYDPTRVIWLNYNTDEGLVPTMYAGDQLIYKSSTYIPTKYSLEKFFDGGYTIGVCGLQQDLSENYQYVSSTQSESNPGHTLSTSNAIGFDGLDASSIYLVAVGDTPVTPENVSLSGTVTGLELMKTYPCDIRTGTEKVAADLTANAHYFSSAETYMFGSFTFITDIIAQLNIPSYVSTGYYMIGDGYFFRYLGDKDASTDYHDLKAEDYDTTIYTYDDKGAINGTTIGLVFDDNDFLVDSSLADKTDTSNVEGSAKTYDDYIATQMTNDDGFEITNRTSRQKNDSGYYTGTYRVDSISEPVISGSKQIYSVKVTGTDNNESLNMQFTKTASNEMLTEGSEYTFTFKPAGSKFDGYAVMTADVISTVEDEMPTIELSTQDGETTIEVDGEAASEMTTTED